MNYAIVGLLWGILKFVISQPIVKVALDNWTKGTSNEIDNLVWAMLKKVADIKDESAREAAVVSGAAEIQSIYDSAKASGKLQTMKAQVKTWDMADLSLDNGFNSSNMA
jgi:hypothetical protein